MIFTDANINARFMNVLYIAWAYIETSSALNIKSYKRTSGPLGRIIKFQNDRDQNFMLFLNINYLRPPVRYNQTYVPKKPKDL